MRTGSPGPLTADGEGDPAVQGRELSYGLCDDPGVETDGWAGQDRGETRKRMAEPRWLQQKLTQPWKAIIFPQALSRVRLCATPIDCSPTRLLCAWDSPGNHARVGGYFLL